MSVSGACHRTSLVDTGLVNGKLGAIKQQSNINPILCHHMTLLGQNELTVFFLFFRNVTPLNNTVIAQVYGRLADMGFVYNDNNPLSKTD